MNNVAQLIEAAARTNPPALFGTFQQHDRIDLVVERARAAVARLRDAGVGRGDIAAMIGTNCASYIVTWMALQFIGAQAALINPGYPDELLGEMLDDLAPDALVWIARAPGRLATRPLPQIDATGAWDGRVDTLNAVARSPAAERSGGDCGYADISAYVHTSGTTGNPKFCALSHGYFLRLGRYFADVMALTPQDVLANPLPLFHINPIGNSVVGALTGGSTFLSSERFAVGEFWPMVKRHGVTALVLHGPPAGMLKLKTTREDAQGHKVRIGFFCDPAFLRQFDIALGVGGYGSTEAGGYCHSQKFRPHDRDLPPEGAMHLSGQPRCDVACMVADDGEILVRGRHPQALFSGYARGGRIEPCLDAEGWFHTGDRGRFDDYGNLIFIERASDAIRVNAEYIPIDFVEERLKKAPSLQDFALWRIDSATRGHEAVVYTTSRAVDLDEVRAAVADLPRYMHPTRVIGIAGLPRDAGVGKIQRRLLSTQAVLESQPV